MSEKMSNERKQYIKDQLWKLYDMLKRMERGEPVADDESFYIPTPDELAAAFDIDVSNSERTPAPLWALMSDEAYATWVKSLKKDRP